MRVWLQHGSIRIPKEDPGPERRARYRSQTERFGAAGKDATHRDIQGSYLELAKNGKSSPGKRGEGESKISRFAPGYSTRYVPRCQKIMRLAQATISAGSKEALEFDCACGFAYTMSSQSRDEAQASERYAP